MIKIIRARAVSDHIIRLEFSDGSAGDYDFTDLLSRETETVRPLKNPEFFTHDF